MFNTNKVNERFLRLKKLTHDHNQTMVIIELQKPSCECFQKQEGVYLNTYKELH